MDYQSYKEVYFYEYCKTCKYKDLKESDEPCEECLSGTTNLNTHRPVHYKKKETK